MASIPFDRAAEYYDRTRRLSPEAMARMLSLLRSELEGHQPCLEIGVGTGRLALPLHEAGIRVAGVDLSFPMLAKLREKAGGKLPIPIAVADALALPFRDASFGSAIAVHVLHVVGDWRRALVELVRVVRSGGVLLVDVGGWGTGWGREIQDRFRMEAGLPRRDWPIDPREVDATMASFGASVRIVGPIHEEEEATLDEHIRRLEEGMYSFTWKLDDDARREAGRRVREWAEKKFGSLGQPRAIERKIAFRAYDLT